MDRQAIVEVDGVVSSGRHHGVTPCHAVVVRVADRDEHLVRPEVGRGRQRGKVCTSAVNVGKSTGAVRFRPERHHWVATGDESRSPKVEDLLRPRAASIGGDVDADEVGARIPCAGR